MSTTNIEDIFPMSPLQEGILFHAVEPGRGLYLSQIACRLRGLDPALFERAWKHVVNRHSGLRSAFVWKATEKPLQVVARRVGVPFHQEDWRGLTDEEVESKLAEFLRQDRDQGLQLSRSPLMRLTLLCTGEDSHLLIWTYHHLVLDGWCRSVVLQEVLTIYQAFVRGVEPALGPSQPYRRYIDWLGKQDLGLATAFWRQRLAGWGEPTPLPLPATNGPLVGGQIGSQVVLLPEVVVVALRSLTARARLTQATVAQGAFALLLARYAGRERILFGTVVSGRPSDLEGVESIVGLFANTQPVLAAPAPERGLVEWLSSLQKDLFEQRLYEHCPLSQVQKCAEEAPAGQPLFNVMFAFQSYPQIGAIPLAAGLEVAEVQAHERADIPLTTMVLPGAAWRLEATYDRSQFADTGILQFLENFRTLLTAMAERPEARLSELSMLSEAERAQILTEWNDTGAGSGASGTAHELFSAWTVVAGEAPAVVWKGGQWSFREVDERANRLAWHLIELGVGPEVVVALLLERSPELLVSLLAVLKAGGAFLPLDPVYPAERLTYLLTDSRAKVVLTRQEEVARIPRDVARRIVDIDSALQTACRAPAEAPSRPAAPASLAYVFYTSGSSGEPKGVGASHETLLGFALEMARQLTLSPDDRMLQFASPAFDVLLEEVFPVWLAGGAVAIAAVDDLLSPQRLGIAMEALGVTLVELPAAFWHVWVQDLAAGQAALPASLRLLLVGAEKPAAIRLAQWGALGVPLIYVFGLTETGVTSSLHRFDSGLDVNLPIGRPVAGARLYVLDPWGEPVPAGVPGELWIAGEGIARGYLGRPEETAWRFRPNGWSVRPGERLYRTGDLARFRWDGRLDFLGRIDDQVKIRGFRVEPGEIAAALRQHPAVADAAVVVDDERGGERRLVGYFSPRSDYSLVGPSGVASGALLYRRQPELWPSHGEYPIYDESLYHQMMQDEERNRRYREAIRGRVPGKVVLDVGTGGEAVLARFCVEAGAARVYAVERSPAAFEAARNLVEQLGLEERIQVILGEATDCELPERVDVCVSELIGTIGGSEGAAAILNRVRRRCLKEEGDMVPRRCVTQIAAVELPEEIRERPRFGQLAAHYAGKVLEQIGENGHLRVCLRNLETVRFLSAAGTFEVLDFGQELAESYEHEVRLPISRAGRLDGFLVWIELEPESGDAVSALAHECSWMPLLFPVFAEGEAVEPGDEIESRVGGAPCADGIHPDYWLAGALKRALGDRVEFSYRSPYRAAAGGEDWFVHRLLASYYRGELAAEEEGITPHDFRRHLAKTLPDFMIPASFVAIPSLPLTPNGKLDRRALPKSGLSPSREQRGGAPRSESEAVLLACWKDVLGIEKIGIHDNFFDLGGDSIFSLRIAASANRRGLEFPPMALFRHQTIAELAATLPPPGAVGVPGPAAEVSAPGEVPLTPIQRWFFAREDRQPEHWNMPILLLVAPRITPRILGPALDRLRSHEAFRLQFARRFGTGWSQERAAEPARIPLFQVDLSALPAAFHRGGLEAAADQVQRSFDLGRAPLLRAVWFDLGEPVARLFLVAHHLVIDSVSWQIVVADLEASCEQLLRGSPLEPLPSATPWSLWATRLAALARSGDLEAEAAIWLDRTAAPLARLPKNLPGGANGTAATESLTSGLDAKATSALLREAPRAYRAQVQHVLLTALVRAFHDWTGAAALDIELEGHGREDLFPDLDLSRTVGWFTSLYPVRLARATAEKPGDDLRVVKEALNEVPRRGIGYGLLRELGQSAAATVLRSRPRPEVLFNYLGQIDAQGERAGLFVLSSEPTGEAIAPGSRRDYLLEVNCRVAEGRFEVRFGFSPKVHRRETIEALAAGYIRELEVLVAHCETVDRPVPSPSDFPLARLDLPTLDGILDRLAAEIDDVYPLTHQQRGMIFHSLFEPGAGTYVAQFVFGLRRSSSAAHLRQAWGEVVSRSAVLRSAFLWEKLDEPLQAVLRHVEPTWLEEDWTDAGEEEATARFDAWLRRDRQRGFDPMRPPLARVALLKRSGAEDWLVFSLYQAVLDGWSLPLLFEDLFALWRGTPAAVLPPRPRYREYVAWLAAQDLVAAESFWRQLLTGFTHPTMLELGPVERLAGSGQGKASSVLAPALRERLQTFARRHRLTLNTLIQGAWGLLLSRTSGEEDVVFGGVVSGRPPRLSGGEAMIGLFINTLPIRVRTRNSEGAIAWLTALQARQAEAEPFGYAPLIDLHRWSQISAGTPLFESIVVFENYPMDRAFGGQAEELGLRRLAVDEQTNYALTVIVQPDPDLRLTVLFDRSRFGVLAIRRALIQLERLLDQLAAAEEGILGDLHLESEAERHQVLVEWNDTSRLVPDSLLLHGLFAAQVSRAPEAVAVVAEYRQISYLELDRRSSLLAWRLRAAGASPDVPIGICLERSAEMVVGLLGILKSGAPYLPLDPEYPARRRNRMIEDAGLSLLVTSGLSAADLVVPHLLFIDVAESPDGAGDATTAAVSAASAAYVIYTSGSTGDPKGAVNPHLAICNRLLWMQDRYRLSGDDRVLQKTPFGFDVSVWEFFWTLAYGARLVMAKPGGHRDGAYLREQILKEGITTLHFVPSMLRAFLTEPELEECVSLTRVICSGEALPADLAADFFSHLRAELHNLYGPTEAAVDVSAWSCDPARDPRMIPIGRPIANLHLHVLDSDLELVPAGVAGELFIAGRGVGRGYLGKPGLTAERFVPSPVGGGPGERMYRTGDRARYLVDGTLEFLGRRDHQVKLRGFRIELGEIEAALREHPAVQDAAAAVVTDAGRALLVAYYVASGPALPSQNLREYLSQVLPAPMVPGIFVALPALPLTPSGKLDRRALPALPAPTDGGGKAPRFGAEEKLASIWEDVLGRSPIGARDHFFELGGDSILAMLVVSRAARSGLRLTPKSLFQNPTLAELAAVAEPIAMREEDSGPIAGEVPLIPVQQWFFEHELVNFDHFNLTTVLVSRDPLEASALSRATSLLVLHHDALRLRFSRDGGRWSQRNVGEEAKNVFSLIDLSSLKGAVRRAVLQKAQQELVGSLNLLRGPLVRVGLLHCGGGEPDLLLLSAHHLATDAVSGRILVEDLTAAYLQARRGIAPTLPPKTTSFKAWAERLREHAQSSSELDREREFWSFLGRQVPPAVAPDFPAGENTSGSFRSVRIRLGSHEVENLTQRGLATLGVQLGDLVLASLASAMAERTGHAGLLVDLERHGREDLFPGIDLSRTVGWFTVIHPLLLEFDALDLGSILRSVKEEMLRIPRRGIGYGLLRYLRAGDGGSAELRGPRAEILFNFLGRIDGRREADKAADLVVAPEAETAASDPRGRRLHLLRVDGFVTGGELEVVFAYSENLFHRSTITALADSLLDGLRRIERHLESPDAGGYSPAEFGLVKLGRQQLDRLARKYQKRSISG